MNLVRFCLFISCLILQGCIMSASIQNLDPSSSGNLNNSESPTNSPTSPSENSGNSNYPKISSNNWVWLSGSKLSAQKGNFVSLGVESDSNPGAKNYIYGSLSDSKGNFWIFGGNGTDSNLSNGLTNDLWKYNTNSGKWTWVSGPSTKDGSGSWGSLGVASSSNHPSARRSYAMAIDSTDNLWIFGGIGYDSTGASGKLGDLWKYNTTTNQWTWVAGSSLKDVIATYDTAGTETVITSPGARKSMSMWIDNLGNIWVFGGMVAGADVNYGWQNDLWRFNITTSRWSYWGGSGVGLTGVSKSGTYGTKGTPSISNWPGARHSTLFTTSKNSQTFYLFGGEGRASTASEWVLNDLWKFDVNTKQWTWLSGSNLIAQSGIYGVKNTPDSLNVPGARTDGAMVIDGNENIWLYGGYGKASSSSDVGLDDFWKYDIVNNIWTWKSGSSTGNGLGEWGNLGIASSSNSPGARGGMIMSLDPKGGIWIYGGDGMVASPNGLLNDLWFYQP